MLEELFRSPAHVRVLKTIVNHKVPIHLRLIASLSGVEPKSVQRVLREFAAKELLSPRSRENKIEYSLNQQHVLAQLLQETVALEQNAEIRNRTQQIQNQPSSLVSRIDQMREVARSVRQAYESRRSN